MEARLLSFHNKEALKIPRCQLSEMIRICNRNLRLGLGRRVTKMKSQVGRFDCIYKNNKTSGESYFKNTSVQSNFQFASRQILLYNFKEFHFKQGLVLCVNRKE